MSDGAKYSSEAIFEVLEELGGKATTEEIFKRARENGLPHDRTHVWDRLVLLSRKGKVVKVGDNWQALP
jgi:Fe2+ or Zn2+ uptake regulation protein